jgi:hypothetical protein
MRRLAGLFVAATLAGYTGAPIEARHTPEHTPPAQAYTLELVDADIWDIIDINNRGDVLIERQLVKSAAPVPLIIKKNGRETSAFECPQTVNDTTAESINNHGEIVGHCGHDPMAPGLFGFVANPRTGAVTLLAFPGAQTTWGYGINDTGQVVGFYANPLEPPFCCFLPPRHLHSFVWNRATNRYHTLDNPLAEAVGGWTLLTGINDAGQIVGYYNTLKNVPWEQYQFLYDRGVFTPIEYPGADETHITGLNNDGDILGWYRSFSSGCPGTCVFVLHRGEYYTIDLPLPDNEPRPDGAPAGMASLISLGGLNDRGQFVGRYSRLAEWGIDRFGNVNAIRSEVGNFIATPPRARKKSAD